MNVANNVITIVKKPTGYVYADFMKPRCFLTLDQLNALNSYEPVKRNSIDELPKMYYVSKSYYDTAMLYLGTNAPASTSIEVTDDFLAQTIFRVVDYITGVVSAGRTNSSYLVAKIVDTKPYTVGVTTVAPIIKGYMLAKDHFDVLQAAYVATEVQSLSFSALPDAGSFTIIFAGNESLPVNFDDQAADLQIALRALAGLETAQVTGSYKAGFMVSVINEGNIPALAIGTTTLTAASVAVDTTVTTVKDGN